MQIRTSSETLFVTPNIHLLGTSLHNLTQSSRTDWCGARKGRERETDHWNNKKRVSERLRWVWDKCGQMGSVWTSRSQSCSEWKKAALSKYTTPFSLWLKTRFQSSGLWYKSTVFKDDRRAFWNQAAVLAWGLLLIAQGRQSAFFIFSLLMDDSSFRDVGEI